MLKKGILYILTILEVILMTLLIIWNRLIEHRVLSCDSLGNLKIEYADKQYPAYKMSDGERVIFYIVGRVMLAKASSLIIVDEPEIHLHKAILNKLWDIFGGEA